MRIGMNGSSLLVRPDIGTITTGIVTAEAEGPMALATRGVLAAAVAG
ncbi:MAG: hypothetical protein ACLGIZ_13465 [Acidimicrobiia bacterium]